MHRKNAVPAYGRKSTTVLGNATGVMHDWTAHSVLPGESCVYCACKHSATAYAEAMTGGSPASVIGELELARRHTELEFPKLATALSEAVMSLLENGTEAAAQVCEPVFCMVDEVAGHASPEPVETSKAAVQARRVHAPVAMNPLVGAVHLFAAWRLAFEIGYMRQNRGMIIGDLVLARENLIRFDFDIGEATRDLRHRVESRNHADLSTLWQETCDRVMSRLKTVGDGRRGGYLPGLRSYLGLPEPEIILEV